jgi:uncharacterized protein YkwD
VTCRILTWRAALALALALLLVPAFAPPATANDLRTWHRTEQRMIDRVNEARRSQGLAPLSISHQMTQIARAWSARMASAGRLQHNGSLSRQVRGPWQRIGENVGYRRNATLSARELVDAVHRAFMGSSSHRGNILGRFNQIGVGVHVSGNGTLWVTVTFLQGPAGQFPLFHDVSAGSSLERDVAKIWRRGVTAGCSATAYCPRDHVTRAQMATFLVRAFDIPASSSRRFSDLGRSTHAANINALAAAGVTVGCGRGRFCPHDTVTRAQMASLIARALGRTNASRHPYSDVRASAHEAGINVMARHRIPDVGSDRRFRPGQPMTRGSMATWLSRALDV